MDPTIGCSWNNTETVEQLLLATGAAPGTEPLDATPGLAQFRGLFRVDWPALTAVVVMATIPILVLYLFFQRYFTAGLAASGVKG